VRIRREKAPGDYRVLIHREGEKPFDARVVELVYYEDEQDELKWSAEAVVFDNDGRLVPASQIEGVVAVLDPGEKINDHLQPKKQARRKRLLRYAAFAAGIAKAVL
jgi:hypothetical protein